MPSLHCNCLSKTHNVTCHLVFGPLLPACVVYESNCRMRITEFSIFTSSWTRQEAIDYMLNYTAETPNSAAIEIDRYTTWPGQACGYKIGEIKIKELRHRAEQELGDLV